jgi:hypothetical protein
MLAYRRGAAVTLLAELERRRVIRALIGYGVAAFAVLQIVERAHAATDLARAWVC